MKFESHWPRGSGEVSFYSKLFMSEAVLAILVEGHLSNIPMKFE